MSEAARMRQSVGICSSIFVGLALLNLYIYSESWYSMFKVWQSPNYSHGFLMLLVSAWLVWTKREDLVKMPGSPSFIWLIAIGLVVLVWCLGYLAGMNVVEHYAVILLLILTTPLVFGTKIGRVLIAAFVFLLFAVPFGEFLVPFMMDWTANVTIWMVRSSGIPIYREGLNFILPSGNWQVVEECSGQRYLVAAIPLACLFAYLTFQSNLRRLLFVGAATLVAIVGNWIRAYGIVMMGHLSSMTIATGIDHLIYGWLFFGVLMVPMFWIGVWVSRKYPEPIMRSDSVSALNESNLNAQSIRRKLWVALLGSAVLSSGPVVSGAMTKGIVGAKSLDHQLTSIDTSVRHESLQIENHGFVPPYKYAREEKNFVFEDISATAWIGRYQNQRTFGEMIHSRNVIRYGVKDKWRMVDRRTIVSLDPQVEYNEYLLSDATKTIRVAEAFWVDQRLTSSRTVAKLRTISQILSGAGDQGIAILVWSSDQAGSAQARNEIALSRLVKSFGSR